MGVITSGWIGKKIEAVREEARIKTFQDVGDAVLSTGNVLIPYSYVKDGEEKKGNIRLVMPVANEPAVEPME